MSESFSEPRNWDVLVARFLDDSLTEPQLSELAELLEKQPELCKILYAHVYQDSLFHDLAKGDGELPDELDLLGEIGSRYMEIFENNTIRTDIRSGSAVSAIRGVRSRKTAMLRILLASSSSVFAVLLFVSLWFYVPLLFSTHSAPPAVAVQVSPGNLEPLSSAVAVVRLASEVWTGNHESSPPKTGDVLPPGRIHFDSGLLVLEFFDGASILVEGPADLRLISSNFVRCEKGRITADVPEQAVGFRIETPQTEILDLGTSFQVEVQQDQVFVNVLEGEVELHKISEGIKPLQKGEHAFIRENAVIDTPGNPVGEFHVPPGSAAKMLEQLQLEEQNRGREKWERHHQWINTDPSLLIHFRFEEEHLFDPRKVPNLVQNRGDVPAYGLLVDGRFARGRWSEKGALEFRRISDRCRFSIPGEFTALSMSTWIRVDALDRLYNSILTTDGIDLGEIHWRLLSTGEIELLIHYSRMEPCLSVRSKKVITPDRMGQWLHLFARIDSENEHIALFLDGVCIHQEKFISTVPIRFRNAQLGNWTIDPAWDSEQPLRHLNGAMESFMFFQRALSDEEVKKLYQGDFEPE